MGVTTARVLGAGWQQLIDEARVELKRLDPDAELQEDFLDADGLLWLRARMSPGMRKQGKELLRGIERRAVVTCERCGDSGRVYAGAVLLVRCASCRDLG